MHDVIFYHRMFMISSLAGPAGLGDSHIVSSVQQEAENEVPHRGVSLGVPKRCTSQQEATEPPQTKKNDFPSGVLSSGLFCRRFLTRDVF